MLPLRLLGRLSIAMAVHAATGKPQVDSDVPLPEQGGCLLQSVRLQGRTMIQEELSVSKLPSPQAALAVGKAPSDAQASGQLEPQRLLLSNLPIEGRDAIVFPLDAFGHCTFWIVWAVWFFVLALTFVIDWMQRLVADYRRHSKYEYKFVHRLNAELMILAILGLGTFASAKVMSEVSAQTIVIFEFIDAMVTLSACGLVVLALALFIASRLQDQSWRSYEETRHQGLEGDAGCPSGEQASRLDTAESGWYVVMSHRFRQVHRLPVEFDFSAYLHDCLMANVCDMVDIGKRAWALFLAVAILEVLASLRAEAFLSGSSQIIASMCMNWLVLLAQIGLLSVVLRARAALAQHLRPGPLWDGDLGEVAYRQLAGDLGNGEWADHVRWWAKVLSITSLFFGFLFVLHLSNAANAARRPLLYKLLLVLPLALNISVVLPLVISQLTVVRAFVVLDREALLSTLKHLERYKGDLASLRCHWLAMGRPFPQANLKERLNKDDLANTLHGLGLRISTNRLHVIFACLVEKSDGCVDAAKLLDAIRDDDATRGKAARAAGRDGDGKGA